MFLLKTKVRIDERFTAYESRDAAIAAGTEFLGEHFPADGASTKPHFKEYPDGSWVGHRGSSFGQRFASVTALLVVGSQELTTNERISLHAAMEFGFKACEKGHNIQMASNLFAEILS